MILIFVILIGIVQASNDKLEQLETLVHALKQDVDHLNNEANYLKQENWNLRFANGELASWNPEFGFRHSACASSSIHETKMMEMTEE